MMKFLRIKFLQTRSLIKKIEFNEKNINELYINIRHKQLSSSVERKTYKDEVGLLFKYYSSIKWTVLGHFLMPNFTPRILTHKILTPNTHA